MGFIETIVHGGLSLWNTWDQGKALFAGGTLEHKEEVNKKAAIAFASKTVEEYFAGRIDGKTAIAKGVNDLADLKTTDYLEKHGVPAPLAKGIGLFAGFLAEKMTKGIEERIFPDGRKTTMDDATKKLIETGKIDPNKPSPELFEKFKEWMSGAKTVDGAGMPAGGTKSIGNFLQNIFN